MRSVVDLCISLWNDSIFLARFKSSRSNVSGFSFVSTIGTVPSSASSFVLKKAVMIIYNAFKGGAFQTNHYLNMSPVRRFPSDGTNSGLWQQGYGRLLDWCSGCEFSPRLA